MKTYKISKSNLQSLAAEIRPLTSNQEVASKLRQAMNPQADGSMLIYCEPTDVFLASVQKFAEVE